MSRVKSLCENVYPRSAKKSKIGKTLSGIFSLAAARDDKQHRPTPRGAMVNEPTEHAARGRP